jgi:hypothetical protein
MENNRIVREKRSRDLAEAKEYGAPRSVLSAIRTGAVSTPPAFMLNIIEVDWERLQKRSGREWANFSDVGIRTSTNGKSGWDCVSWHYARIFGHCIDNHHAYLRSNREIRTITYRESKINNAFYWKENDGTINTVPVPQQPTRALTRAQVIRVARRLLKRGEVVVDDGYYGIAFIAHREVYHLRDVGTFYESNIPNDINRARAAIDQRRRERVNRFYEERVLNSASLATLLVTAHDSIAAGNCQYGTDQYVNNTLLPLWKKRGFHVRKLNALYATSLLSIRNDDFTRRAVVAAYRRSRAA